jgi:hypothetical protein
MEATEKHKGKTIVKVISTGTMPLFPVLNSLRRPSGRRKFLERLQSWPERVRVKALAAAACF